MKHLKNASLQAYLDHELKERPQNRAARHLKNCAACREKLQNAKKILKFAFTELEVLSPDKTPAPAPFISRPQRNKEKRGFSFRRFAFASVRIPSIILVLMGSAVLILAGLLYSEKHRKDSSKAIPRVETVISFLTMVSPGRTESIPLDIPLGKFSPVKDPTVFILKEINQ